MKPAILTFYVITFVLVRSIDSHGTPMSTNDLVSFCNRNSPVCGIYLQGAYDGILQAARNTGTRLVCAPKEPTAAQLREYFMVANTLAGEGHGEDPAINMAYVAFKSAMPCN